MSDYVLSLLLNAAEEYRFELRGKYPSAGEPEEFEEQPSIKVLCNDLRKHGVDHGDLVASALVTAIEARHREIKKGLTTNERPAQAVVLS